ncbi:LysR family transcriptional regulator [Parasphingopyxis algicola]|uniref:LysR family transcriptional regulator n=1 Tax=Parasphingopyxis algicola TaxID=2026624 RepID=UPI0015A1633D|nr:LysR family transcriptional regulator [Parasphingopyxis algicola]QLC25739.1 LysR family transcriptional regulator [Parasphingopyxis algicola]
MDRLLSLEMFVAVAREGGFAAAARRLRVSASSVTRGIAALEQRLGVSLFHRSTRAVKLTEEGADLLPRAAAILDDVADAERIAGGPSAEPHGRLVVTAPVLFGRLHVLPVVGELIDRYPALDIDMMLVDRNVRIVEEGIDAAVRIGELSDSALRAVRIGAVHPAIVASPAYLARFGTPETPADLDRHRLIASSGPRALSEWRFGQPAARPPRPRLRVNTVDSALAAAEAGIGIASLLSYQAAPALQAGRLVELLRSERGGTQPVHLLFAETRSGIPAVRRFIEAMRERGRAHGWGG